jgi:ATP-dependent DNA helicase RecQ
MSRRKYLLHYFGEEFDEINGEGASMDDNVKNPKKKSEAKDELKTILEVVTKSFQKYKAKEVVNILIGKVNALLKSHKTDEKDFFGIGNKHTDKYWMALIRQALVAGFLRKEIEEYGVIKITEKGTDFIQKPFSFMMTEDHTYDTDNDDSIITNQKGGGAVVDETLMKLLKDLQKSVAKKNGVPPYAVIQETSLEDMTLKYPINMDELKNIYGVGEGKARKYGKPFVDLIAKYVEENDIVRPDDIIVKSTGVNSSLKLFIIQNTDRKLPLMDIAKSKGLTFHELIEEMQRIVYSGTKLNISYCINEHLDEEQQEEIFDYFMENESDRIQDAMDEFDGEYEEDELRLMRIKFISEVAN